MQNFENVEDLVSHMFEKLDGDKPASVVADKNLAIAIVQELLDYDDVILNFANVDTYDYDKEYLVSLYDDTDTDYWYVGIEQIYDYEKDIYLGTDGYVLFHEDVNSKALIDMQNNELMPLGNYDWFIIGEDEETDETESNNKIPIVNGKHVGVDEYNDFVSKFAPDKIIKTNDGSSTVVYKVNSKNVTKEKYENVLSKIEDGYIDYMRDMLLNYCEFIDEIIELRKLFL